jgi:hypothetical protein
MTELKEALYLYAARFLTQSKYVKVIVSGSDREGEGEYKIFEYLKHWRQHEPGLAVEKKSLKCLILGNDTDMILFSLLSVPELEIDLLRVDGPQKTITKVEEVRKALLKDLHGDSARLILDWSLLTVLCGTDFAPRLGGFDYRKVYAMWRQFKSDPSHSEIYMVKPLAGGDFELNIENFDEILKGSNFVEFHYHRLSIATENKTRTINLSNSDWKCNWNTLKQAFCSDLNFEVQTSKLSISTGSHSYLTQIYWTSSKSRERILAAEGTGINPRTSEYFACLSVCRPSSSVMRLHIRSKMSLGDFEMLSAAIEQASSSGVNANPLNEKPKLKSVHTFAASSSSPEKRVYALTKGSKTIDDCPEACEQLLNSAFWMLNLLSAKFTNCAHFYPFNLVPSVDAMQSYLQALHSKQLKFKWSIEGLKSDSEQNEENYRHYSLDALPSLQYLFMLSKSSPDLLRTIHQDAQTLLCSSTSSPLQFKVNQIQTDSRHILEKTTMDITREAFERELQEHAQNLSIPVDPLLIRNESSLLFMNSILPSSTSEDRERSAQFEKQNSEILKEAVPCDFSRLGQVVHARIKTWTGSKFRKISVFAESHAVSSAFSGLSFRRFNVPVARPYSTRVSSPPTSYTTSFSSIVRRLGKRMLRHR